MKTKDNIPLKESEALEMAKKQLKGTDYFAAVYGQRLDHKSEFFLPVLMDEEELKATKDELNAKGKENTLYVIYQSNLEDAPLYEINYKNKEAYVDIPDEEIMEFMKKRLVEISNSPRLMEKYKHGLEDLLEEDLQQYANKQFYEEGRGEIVEDSVDKVDLDYDDLMVKFWKKIYSETQYEPEEWDYEERKTQYTYQVPRDEIIDALIEILWDKEEFENYPKEKLTEYINKDFDKVVDENKKELLEYFREFAEEKAEDDLNSIEGE